MQDISDLRDVSERIHKCNRLIWTGCGICQNFSATADFLFCFISSVLSRVLSVQKNASWVGVKITYEPFGSFKSLPVCFPRKV